MSWFVQQFSDYMATLSNSSINAKPTDIENIKILVNTWCSNYQEKTEIFKHKTMLADLVRRLQIQMI